MKYREAIRKARNAAMDTNVNYVVYRYPSGRWFRKWIYDWCGASLFEITIGILPNPIVKFLTITPTGTIVK